MSLFDTMDNVKYNFGRFFLPIVFFIVGLFLLKMALVPEIQELNNGEKIPIAQNSNFLYASLFFLLASVVWFLYLFGIVKTVVGIGVMAVLAFSGVFLIYTDYMNIKSTVDFDAAVDLRDLDIKARMDDVKQAELAYKEMNGVYTDSMDDLINFVKTGKKMKILKKGSIPERKIWADERDFLYGDDRPIDKLMTEIEATALSRSKFKTRDNLKEFSRDTNYVPVMEAIFMDEKRIATRDKIGATMPFYADSLRFVPYSTNLVKLDTGSVLKGEVHVPTVYIEMIHPMSADMEDTMRYAIGDVNDNNLRESWKEK